MECQIGGAVPILKEGHLSNDETGVMFSSEVSVGDESECVLDLGTDIFSLLCRD